MSKADEERPYTRKELLSAVTRGDAESCLEGLLEERATPALVDEFAEALKHAIDADAGRGEQPQVAGEVTYDEFLEAHPELASAEEDDDGGE
jgi:hypothetical protein